MWLLVLALFLVLLGVGLCVGWVAEAWAVAIVVSVVGVGLVACAGGVDGAEVFGSSAVLLLSAVFNIDCFGVLSLGSLSGGTMKALRRHHVPPTVLPHRAYVLFPK